MLLAKVPEGIPNDQESHVFLISIRQDLIAVGLNHFTIGQSNNATIVSFLLNSGHQPWDGGRKD